MVSDYCINIFFTWQLVKKNQNIDWQDISIYKYSNKEMFFNQNILPSWLSVNYIKNIHLLCYCTVHVSVVVCDSVWPFWVEANLFWYLIYCLYLYCRRSKYVKVKDWDPINLFNSATFLCLSQSRIKCCGLLFAFSGLRWEAIVRFLDIGGIVGHHYLKFVS